MRAEFIAKLEAAAEGDRELDCDIALIVLGGEIEWKQANHTMEMYPVRRYPSPIHVGGVGREPVMNYTTSLDAALTLVPYGWWADIHHGADRHSCVLQEFPLPCRRIPKETPYRVGARTTALALCIAALKARGAP